MLYRPSYASNMLHAADESPHERIGDSLQTRSETWHQGLVEGSVMHPVDPAPPVHASLARSAAWGARWLERGWRARAARRKPVRVGFSNFEKLKRRVELEGIRSVFEGVDFVQMVWSGLHCVDDVCWNIMPWFIYPCSIQYPDKFDTEVHFHSHPLPDCTGIHTI